MPNLVDNRITLFGRKAPIDRAITALTGMAADTFREKIAKDPDGTRWLEIRFTGIVPRPAILDDTVEGSALELGLAALSTPDKDWMRLFDLAGHENWVKRHDEVVTRTQVLERHGLQGLEGDDLLAQAELAIPGCIEAGRAGIAAYEEAQEFSWFDWAMKNWGCKWAPDQAKFEFTEEGALTFRFETPDLAPDAFIEALAAAYPELEVSGAAIEKDNDYCVFFDGSEGEVDIIPGDEDDIERDMDRADIAVYLRTEGSVPRL